MEEEELSVIKNAIVLTARLSHGRQILTVSLAQSPLHSH